MKRLQETFLTLVHVSNGNERGEKERTKRNENERKKKEKKKPEWKIYSGLAMTFLFAYGIVLVSKNMPEMPPFSL